MKMMCESFYIETIKEKFDNVWTKCLDNHEIQYPYYASPEYKKFIENRDNLWNEYGEDVEEYIIGEVGENYNLHDTYEVAKAIMNGFIDFCKENPKVSIDVESYWKILMIKAIEMNAESFFEADGPCDVYGELI